MNALDITTSPQGHEPPLSTRKKTSGARTPESGHGDLITMR